MDQLTEPDQADQANVSDHAKSILANPPERIYLQVGDVDSDFPGEISWRDVTWCEDQIERSDLVYISQKACELAHRNLISAVQDLLSNDGGDGSQRFSALRLHEARERTKAAIKEIKAFIGENHAKDST